MALNWNEIKDSSLADLYDPLTMPPALVKPHNDLDKAVDLAYRAQPFTSEANRMEFLFGLMRSTRLICLRWREEGEEEVGNLYKY
jgi:hypothetical protein